MSEEDALRARLHSIIGIGAALSSEHDLERLLARIVDEARALTGADGGTLFLLSEDGASLRWAIVQSETMSVRVGGPDGQPLDEATFSPVARFGADGAPKQAQVASWVSHAGEAIRIADVYDPHDRFDFTGPLQFDARTGYRTRSMLVVPLRHFDGGVIGVLQLINARDASGHAATFSDEDEALTLSLASQAAVALKNAQLFAQLEHQFEAFIRTIAMAIDEKSPYTAGHVRRVVTLAMALAEAINRERDDPRFGPMRLSAEQLKALRVASWMHDIGKIAIPEHVVDKATKLSGLHDRIALVETRYVLFEQAAKARALRAALDAPDADARSRALKACDAEIAALRQELELIQRCNQGGEFLSDALVARLEAIGREVVMLDEGRAIPKLTPDEVYNLTIRKGTLTPEEITVIRDHAAISYRMLAQLPFSRALVRVPEIAAGHHEKLNGRGYPRGLRGDQLSLEARILAIADIFEALTAADRPYKKPTPLSTVRRILHAMVRDGELDPALVAFAMRSGVFDHYATREIAPALRDTTFAAPLASETPEPTTPTS